MKCACVWLPAALHAMLCTCCRMDIAIVLCSCKVFKLHCAHNDCQQQIYSYVRCACDAAKVDANATMSCKHCLCSVPIVAGTAIGISNKFKCALLFVDSPVTVDVNVVVIWGGAFVVTILTIMLCSNHSRVIILGKHWCQEQ